METFGRGCLYIIIGMFVLFVIAFMAQSQINIPIFIVIPLVILAFYIAKKQSDKNKDE